MPFTIRRCQSARDLPVLAELISAVQGTLYSVDQARSLMAWPGHDLDRDRFVAEGEGRLVGMSMLYPSTGKRIYVNASVHPDFRRRGVGRALLEQVIDEARQRGAQQAVADFGVADEAARGFAAACGFLPAGESRFFNAPADLTLPEPELPEGFTLRSVAELNDTQAFADACNRCYQDMWGHSENLEPVTVAQIEQWRSKYPGILRPAGMFVLLAPDGSPVGVTRADRQGEGAEELRVIDAPGVTPEFRDLGLQRTLVQAAAAWLKENGSGPYQIQTWGDSAEAALIYAELGFQLDEASHTLEFVRYL